MGGKTRRARDCGTLSARAQTLSLPHSLQSLTNSKPTIYTQYCAILFRESISRSIGHSMTRLERLMTLAAKTLRLSDFCRLRNSQVGFVELVTLALERGLYKPQRRLSVVWIPCPSILWGFILESSSVFVVIRSYLASDAAIGNLRDFVVKHGGLGPFKSISWEHPCHENGTSGAQISISDMAQNKSRNSTKQERVFRKGFWH